MVTRGVARLLQGGGVGNAGRGGDGCRRRQLRTDKREDHELEL